MALSLGKLTVLIGAVTSGLVGSALAKEGVLLDVSNLVSGILKMVFRQLKQEEPSKLASKPYNDTLVTQLLASNRPETIVTTAGAGVLCLQQGAAYQMHGTKRELSSEIERMGRSLDANTKIIQKTGGEVTELRDGTEIMKDEVRSVFDAVETLAIKVYRIEENQDITLRGVGALNAQCRANIRIRESNQALPPALPLPALEPAPITLPSRRTLSLPPVSPCESQSPSTPNGAQQSHDPLQHTQSTSGLKDLTKSSSNGETFSSGTYSGGNSASGSSSGMLGRFSIPKIARVRTAVNTLPTN